MRLPCAEELLEPEKVACYQKFIWEIEANPNFETWNIFLFQQMSRIAEACIAEMHQKNGTKPKRNPLDWEPSRIRL